MDIDLTRFLSSLGLAIASGLFALPIAYEREAAHRTAGLRTFPVVALASCAYVLIGQEAFAGDAQAQARIVQGLLAGMGFIGGGAILKQRGEEGGTVVGIATAASLWNTGAIGAAVAYHRFGVAFVLSTVNYLILRYIKPVTPGADEEQDYDHEGD